MPVRLDVIHALSRLKREILIEHIDGPIQITRNDTNRIQTIKSLLERGWLRNDRPGPIPSKPRALVLTEAGRYVVSIILSEYAEALIRAGCLEPGWAETPMQILRRLKSVRKPAISPETALEPARAALLALEK
jgi:hypothetical protein